MAALDPGDRLHDDGAAALEVLVRQHLLAVLLEPGRPADAEDVLPHVPPDPVLRVPQREKARLKTERLAVVIDAESAREVVQRQLNVRHLRPEVRFVGVLHRLARAGLVVDDLHLAVADVVDPVDLADDLDAVQLEVKSPLHVESSQAADQLQPGDESDVVAEDRTHLELLALAVQHALHVRQIRFEVG